jgi:hypothetical protein
LTHNEGDRRWEAESQPIPLNRNWDNWDAKKLIPTEGIPKAHKTKRAFEGRPDPLVRNVCNSAAAGHPTLAEELDRLKPQIVKELGKDRGEQLPDPYIFAIPQFIITALADFCFYG